MRPALRSKSRLRAVLKGWSHGARLASVAKKRSQLAGLTGRSGRSRLTKQAVARSNSPHVCPPSWDMPPFDASQSGWPLSTQSKEISEKYDGTGC